MIGVIPAEGSSHKDISDAVQSRVLPHRIKMLVEQLIAGDSMVR